MAELEPAEGLEAFPEERLAPQMLQVDPDLSPLQAVQEWAAEGNPPGQRVAYIMSIPAAAAECSLAEARLVLLPLLAQLVFDDHPDIKQATAEVLGPLGPILASKDPEAGEAGGSEDAFELLVLAHRLLQDPERAIQQAAASSVAMFAGLLSAEHLREHLSAVVDELMRNYDDEQMQECAVDLLAKVAAAAGPAHPDWCEECALPRVLKLANHRDYNIRANSVSGLVQLAGCLPLEARSGQLMSAFAELCADSVWSVRQGCASELAVLAQQLPREALRDRLLPLWEALVTDVSAWAKAAARRQAGPLLTIVHPDDCPEALLECFLQAASGPATLTEASAHYLPSVLANLGVNRWPQLRELMAALVASEYVSVRVTLAERLHELLGMLGPQRVDDDLLALVERLSADDNQAVADALAVNIQALLAALPPHGRLPQLAFLSHIHPEDGSSCGQWRMRLLIAEQLAGIAALLERQGLAEVLLPATLRLCEDPVAAVREAAAAQLGCMVRSLLLEMGEPGSNGGSSAAQPPAAQERQDGSSARGAAPAAVADAPASQAGAEQQASKQEAEAERGQQEEQLQHAHQQPEQQQQQSDAEQQQAQQAQQADQPGASDGAEDELEQDATPPPGNPAAVVQQIVQHLVELRRSGGHRSRQTYLAFCAALLLPQPGPAPAAPTPGPPTPQPTGGSPLASAVAAAVAASPGRHAAAAQQGQQAETTPEPSWPQLPEAVVQSGIAQGLLEGAVALAADPVPNVRLAVARLLAAVKRQQPALAASSPKVEEALAALAADADRDVQASAAGDC
ncbi:phosphatase 4 regulatory subunit 1 [Chlorella sorokiniana]|uniref:Phosphatase 4 regulatory subunit 1 n=1 Tax=Chlorella sorokiniana TaxID=3076 RepID=A0A2P6TZA9_CHLSO|nr:phosphatase 4 regulatory subunit 1 [Chlorella sorokiniana]|eukprot:PRW59401.1 phosphatase 4 regulatory subunit 1 [Chlorella sorokiniana]